jgi:hypothetical protein
LTLKLREAHAPLVELHPDRSRGDTVMRIRRLIVSCACVLAAIGCSSNPDPGTPESQLAEERQELQTLLARHAAQRIDARAYGLPRDDFDDVTNLTLRQRRAFRQMYPNLDFPDDGPRQYPRWAYSLMNRLDHATAGAPAGTSLDSRSFGLTINANVNVSNDNLPRSETFLAIDPTNPQYMVGASNIDLNGNGQALYFSSDFGSSWSKLALTPVFTNHSDPGVSFDSSGNVYTSTLDYGGNKTQVAVYKSTDHGASWPTRIVVDQAAANDKDLVATDYQSTSACHDQTYVGWDSGKTLWVSSGSGAFAPKIAVQTKSSVIAADPTVGPPATSGAAAPAYLAWADIGNSTINFSKSTDCGASWAPKSVVAATTDSYDYGIPAQCNRRVLIYPTIDVDRSSGSRRGWIYAVWNDFTMAQRSGCIAANDPHQSNIWFARSSDGGSSWSSPAMVNTNQPFVDHFNQWMSVDDSDGTIHVSWYDTRNDPNRQKTDIYYTKSTDGGLTFLPEVKVTSSMSDETTAGASGDQYGDYGGLAARGGNAYPFWADRRVQAPEQVYTALITP